MEPFARAAAALEEGRGVAIVELLAEARTLVDRLRSARPLTADQRAQAAAVVERTANQLKAYWQRQPLVVRAVQSGAGGVAADVHRSIEGLAQAGEIALRLDAGTAFASAEDRVLAPAGPRGMRRMRARRCR
jgi:hypothetical protein